MKKSAGFTLIEMVVVLSLLALVFAGVTTGFVPMTRMYSVVRTEAQRLPALHAAVAVIRENLLTGELDPSGLTLKESGDLVASLTSDGEVTLLRGVQGFSLDGTGRWEALRYAPSNYADALGKLDLATDTAVTTANWYEMKITVADAVDAERQTTYVYYLLKP